MINMGCSVGRADGQLACPYFSLAYKSRLRVREEVADTLPARWQRRKRCTAKPVSGTKVRDFDPVVTALTIAVGIIQRVRLHECGDRCCHWQGVGWAAPEI